MVVVVCRVLMADGSQGSVGQAQLRCFNAMQDSIASRVLCRVMDMSMKVS
jgi:hypothetical protein